MNASSRLMVLRSEEIRPPAGLGWVPPIRLRARGQSVLGDVAPWSLVSAVFSGGKEVYVDPSRPDDNGSGLSWGAAKKTFEAAFRISTRRIIYLKPGVYECPGGAVSPDADRGPTALVACGSDGAPVSGAAGEVYIQNSDLAGSWTQEGTSGAYHAPYNRSSVEVRDAAVLTDGYATILTLATSSSDCQAKEGTYWLDDPGNLLWVHRVGGLAPDGNLIVSGAAAALNLTGYDYYMRGIVLRGGKSCLVNTASAACNLYADTCVAEYAGVDQNGFGISQWGMAVLRRCVARANANDGFNYARESAVGNCRVVEVDCESYDNGRVGGTTNNASSAHQQVSVVRVRGKYYRCYGPVVVDVGTGKRWNVGVWAHDTLCPTDGSDRAFHEDGEAWYDRCRATGCPASTGGSGTLHARRCSWSGDLDTVPVAY